MAFFTRRLASTLSPAPGFRFDVGFFGLDIGDSGRLEPLAGFETYAPQRMRPIVLTNGIIDGKMDDSMLWLASFDFAARYRARINDDVFLAPLAGIAVSGMYQDGKDTPRTKLLPGLLAGLSADFAVHRVHVPQRRGNLVVLLGLDGTWRHLRFETSAPGLSGDMLTLGLHVGLLVEDRK